MESHRVMTEFKLIIICIRLREQIYFCGASLGLCISIVVSLAIYFEAMKLLIQFLRLKSRRNDWVRGQAVITKWNVTDLHYGSLKCILVDDTIQKCRDPTGVVFGSNQCQQPSHAALAPRFN
jgi:hypothetical protein